mmetsp:Transcript_124000/g.246912  ORF Transcript_124000/g.246912 Transcript_124000/m.246912 type:complete len:418 (+) Transcript_124000:35-1288(+)
MAHVKVPPNPNYVAEVVVLLTSLGAKRSELNAGRLACDLLEIKRAHRKVIDFNLDARAGRDAGEDMAIERLEAKNSNLRVEAGDLPLPQIFVDGVYLGDTAKLQSLEDDGLLGRILRRQLCVKCLRRKSCDSMYCRFCRLEYEEVLHGHMRIEDELVQYYGTYTDEDRQEEESDSGDDADDRFTAYEAALEAATRPAPAKKITVRRTGHTVRKGKGDIMFEERQRLAALEGSAGEHLADGYRISDVVASKDPSALPELQGYLWKKSPNQLRFRSFSKRYVILRGMKLYWWKTKQDASDDKGLGDGPLCKGFLDFAAGPVELKPMLENSSTFTLMPSGGLWVRGATRKGDPGRPFTFDTTGCEYGREVWVGALTKHIRNAPCRQADRATVVPDDDFYAAVGLPIPSSSSTSSRLLRVG